MLHLNSQLAARIGSGASEQQQSSTSMIMNNHALKLAQAGVPHGSNTTNNSFISPMRGVSSMAAVPHHLNQQQQSLRENHGVLNSASNLLIGGLFPSSASGMSRPHLNSQLQRDLSSSPYHHNALNKKKMEKLSRVTISGISTGGNAHHHDPLYENDHPPTQTLQGNSSASNRLLAYNLITLEDAERKYLDILDNEKQLYKKKEQASREIIQELSRKLKQQDKRQQEEGKVATELKKRHDLMKKRLEKSMKDKSEVVAQLKSLFALYTEQRKALQVSIAKSKRLEEDNQRLDAAKLTTDDQNRALSRKLETLEQERDLLSAKHRREREQLESDFEEKRQLIKKLESDVKEASSGKTVMKKQIDEYESKVKKLIYEFEETSKKHIRELNEVHEQYRGYKSSSIELEQRIAQYKADMQRALDSERASKKEVHRLNLENDELRERLRFVDQRYNQALQRFGASPEDLQEIEEQLKHNKQNRAVEDDEAQIVYKKRGGQQQQYAEDMMMVVGERTEMEQEIAMIDQAVNGDRARSSKGGRRGTDQQPQRRTESRLERRPEESARNNQVSKQLNNASKYLMPVNQAPQQQQQPKNSIDFYQQNNNPGGGSDQLMLLQKLMGNLKENPALQNVYIREIFKLKNIRGEQDLQEYKNLLNSMAALFYTNHRMTDVTQLFYVWRQAATQKQEERMRNNQKKVPGAAKAGPPRIQIDTELANQEAFKNYHHLNQPGAPPVGAHLNPQFIDDEPSEIPQGEDLRKNMMIHIEGDENMDMLLNDDNHVVHSVMDEDVHKDMQTRAFLAELLQVGPFAKQILNYSYPPLLYQRGDGEEEEDDEDDEEDEDEEAVRDILDGGGNGGFQLPEFEDDEEYEVDDGMDDEDREIQELVKGAHNNHNQLLMEDHDFDYEQEGNQNQQIIDGEDDMMDDEEFLAMMEQEAAHGRMLRAMAADPQAQQHQQNSTIINSSQNTSLEENFMN